MLQCRRLKPTRRPRGESTSRAPRRSVMDDSFLPFLRRPQRLLGPGVVRLQLQTLLQVIDGRIDVALLQEGGAARGVGPRVLRVKADGLRGVADGQVRLALHAVRL